MWGTFCLLFGLCGLDLGPFSVPPGSGVGGWLRLMGSIMPHYAKSPLWPMPPWPMSPRLWWRGDRPHLCSQEPGRQVLDQGQGRDKPSALVRGRAGRWQRDSLGEGILLFFTPYLGPCPVFQPPLVHSASVQDSLRDSGRFTSMLVS